MNTNDFTIRPEKKEDRRAVENLIREAFWNVYRPGCRSVKKMCRWHIFSVGRSGCAARREVMGCGGYLTRAGQAPPLQGRGYGKKLLDFCLRRASEMGFGAVLFEGNIGFYSHCGFDYARNFGIRYHDLPEGEDDSFFLCRELIPGYLSGVTGVYETPKGYYVDDADVEEFDKSFPPKEKLKLPGQLFG